MRVAKGKAVPTLVHPAAPDRRKHTVQELIAGVLTRLKRIFLLQLAADSNLTTDVGRRRANSCTRVSDGIHCFSVSCKNASRQPHKKQNNVLFFMLTVRRLITPPLNGGLNNQTDAF
ncbi:hypothetical protein [Lonsdalea quercina]|uniref:hypothetical protein n=1 Tax=Lonsdalea quercina TaxID=71657 RepID=UPI003F48F67C